MKTIKTLDTLLLDSSPLTDAEMTSIIGGDDFMNTLFSTVFDFSAANLTQAAIDLFKKELTDLNSTYHGHQLLAGLISGVDQKIKVTGDMPHAPSAAAEYDKETNRFLLGNLDTNTQNPYYNNALTFNAIVHETYHARINGQLFSGYETMGSVAYVKDQRSEIDATFFAYMAAAEYDIAHNLSFNDRDSHVRGGGSLAVENPQTASEIAVRNAWNDIFLNGNFTVANYNIIEKNFTTGTTYKTPNGKTSNPINQLSDVFSSFIFLNSDGFIKQTRMFKMMIENGNAHPNDILQANPNIRNVPSPWDTPPASGSSGSGGGGGGGGGTEYPNPGSDTTWGWPGNGTGNSGGDNWTSDKTGWYQYFDQIYPQGDPGGRSY